MPDRRDGTFDWDNAKVKVIVPVHHTVSVEMQEFELPIESFARLLLTSVPSERVAGLSARQKAARIARSEHRTTVDVAPERNGVAYEGGKRLTDTFQYRSRCMCGWVGPTMPTAQEARATGVAHRGEKIAEACCG